MSFLEPLKTLREPLFARLYFAQAISLLGDSITWVGIALLAFEFGGSESSGILGTALTLRVTAFIMLGSVAGILADRISRKKIMIISNIFRMAIVVSLAFVTAVWQLYTLIFILNIFNAFFSPAYKSTIPQLISGRENYGNAISLSNATWQILGILGPGLAGIIAAAWGSREIFFIDALTFLVSIILVAMIPIPGLADQAKKISLNLRSAWNDAKAGTRLVFSINPVRFALFIELSSAIAGAQILVNTIGHIKGGMMLGDDEYGFLMSAFGAGATIAAFTASTIDKSPGKAKLLTWGGLILALAVTCANFVPYGLLAILWIMAGAGLSYSEIPSQILIAENISKENHGKAYGSHFAWMHVWWAAGYITAGLTGTLLKGSEFMSGGIMAVLIITILLLFRLRSSRKVRD